MSAPHPSFGRSIDQTMAAVDEELSVLGVLAGISSDSEISVYISSLASRFRQIINELPVENDEKQGFHAIA
ncbi:hypothetical protein [Novosphingobium sp. PhB55]|uniref:hypothetical protein n=1 Tax=Novosphingobium sp. PhB55 TaxID=2485106 RepID=UPI001065F05F|nr:hypothetical protein [Novosphingobium sp. PhB55]